MTHVECLGIMQYIGVAQKKMCRRTTSEFIFTRVQKSKTHFAEDIEFVKDTPIFSTSKRPLIFYQEWYGIVDDKETEMTALRWKIISFNYQIPLNRQMQIPPCERCFTALLSV